ncbi:MAG: hypothetical protein QNJ40_07555 [Xanthomonadales bacterium]|nr:hypothetical protein [Xanthomonadales bacterium]
MNRYMLVAPLALFGVAGVALYYYFMQGGAGGPFHDNLLPELIGFCIEGFFLVGLLSFFQQTREHERRKALWLSLRGALREFLSHLDVAFLAQDAEPSNSQSLEQDPTVVGELLGKLKESELDLDSMVSLKEIAIRNLGLAHDLIPVAAQLSAGHMRWWIAIVDAMRSLTEAGDRDAVERSIYTMLMNVREFDDLRL